MEKQLRESSRPKVQNALHRSRVTLPDLRFALIVMVNFRGDSHPESGAHAGRTKRNEPGLRPGSFMPRTATAYSSVPSTKSSLPRATSSSRMCRVASDGLPRPQMNIAASHPFLQDPLTDQSSSSLTS